MSFYQKYLEYRNFDFENYFESINEIQIKSLISKDILSELDFLTLLSGTTSNCIEPLARRSQQLTHQHFGKVVFLYTPIYLANFCVNHCVYCGFNSENKIKRMKLSLEEVEREAEMISGTGLKHILVLTGESRAKSPVSYIGACVEVLKKYFTSISIEIYPLEVFEYEELINSGVDGLTIYQEVYNEDTYGIMHIKGPKTDYLYRLDAPERACKASMRSVGVGALLGLDNWRKEVFFTGLHAAYLQDKYPETEISVSLPRMRPQTGSFEPKYPVSDKDLVQAMLALRMFLPRAGITISTRERAELRDNLIGLGVTKMSAGSSTEVGGHSSSEKSEGQFAISDERNVEEIKDMIYKKGYQPVFKDWQALGTFLRPQRNTLC